jgi:NAD(P)-dependent dehydrogenase (short-subunit alcohol dehydrogenase family)
MRRAQTLGGRLAVVTGAGNGIGRATALALAQRHVRVVAVDLDGAAAERTALDTAGRAERVDVSDAAAMDDLADRVGVADIVVNNAGVGAAGPFLDTEDDDWRRVLDVNLWGVIHGSRAFGRRMVEAGRAGHIVNVASLAAYLPSRSMSAYGTSKAAVLMLSECLHAELAEHGIGVSCVCPGFTRTGIIERSRFVGVDDAEEQRRRRQGTRLLARRNYPPERVAAAIVEAIERNRAVVPVSPEARATRLLSRVSPGLARTLARLDIANPRGRS